MKQLTKTNQKERKNKGITLIALVITIIVLLILAAVSISTLTGDNGILTKASNAKRDTEEAAAREKVQMAVLASYGTDGKIDIDQLNSNLNKVEGIDKTSGKGLPISDLDEDRTVYVDGYAITINKEGKVTVGDKENNETETSNLAKDKLKINPSATTEAQRSPYVSYNGMTCRVLYDNTSSYGLQIMPIESIGKVNIVNSRGDIPMDTFGNMNLSADFIEKATCYNHAVEILNNKANEYKDNQGIVTKARCLGSSPDFMPDVADMYSEETGGYSQWDNVFKNSDNNYVDDVNQITNLAIMHTSGTAWLASRCIYKDGSNLGFYVGIIPRPDSQFSPGCWSFDVNGLCSATGGYTNNPSHDFYPVFAISDNAKIIGGEGTAENPYVLGL